MARKKTNHDVTQLKLNHNGYSDAAGLFLVFMFGIIIHVILLLTVFSFDKALAVYDDELRYYDIARSLFNGDGVRIRDIPVTFQKIGYSLMIMPFFAVKDVVLRLKLMAASNIVIMNLSVIFVWLICQELKLSRRAKYFVSFLTAIWPDMIYSFTFMSETLYWPMTAALFWLWLVNERRQSFILSVIMGLFCYYMYLTKEVTLAFLIALVAFELVYPVLSFALQDNKTHMKFREFFCWKRIMLVIVLLAVFTICYAAIKMTLFSGLGNSYGSEGQYDQIELSAIMSPYNFAYTVYAFFYYISALLAALFVVPAVYPIINFKHMNENSRKFFCYIVLFAVVLSATIAYTISVRENLGDITPTLHLRYYGSFFIMLIIVFFSSIQSPDTESIIKNRKFSAAVLTVSLMYTCFMFKGWKFLTPIDQYLLLWYSLLNGIALTIYPPMLFPPQGKVQIFFPSAIIAAVLMVVIAIFFQRKYVRKGKTSAQKFFASLLLLLAVILNVYISDIIRAAYMVHSDETPHELTRIAEYFRNDDTSNILYLNYDIPERRYDYFNRYADTYIDRRRFYIVNYDTISADNPVDVSNITLEAEDPDGLYENVQGIDYILLERENSAAQKGLLNAEPIDGLCGEHFMLYRNLDRNAIHFKLTSGDL